MKLPAATPDRGDTHSVPLTNNSKHLETEMRILSRPEDDLTEGIRSWVQNSL